MLPQTFELLKKDFPNIAFQFKNAQDLIDSNFYESAIIKIGTVAEMIATKICKIEGKSYLLDQKGKHISQSFRINSLYYDEKIITRTSYYDFKDILNLRNELTHLDPDKPITKPYLKEVKTANKKLFRITEWFCLIYGYQKVEKEIVEDPLIVYELEPDADEACEEIFFEEVEDEEVLFDDLELMEEYIMPKSELLDKKYDQKRVKHHTFQRKEYSFGNQFKSRYSMSDLANSSKEAQQLELIQDIKRLKRFYKNRTNPIKLANITKEMIKEIKQFKKEFRNNDLKHSYSEIIEDLSEINVLFKNKGDKESILVKLDSIEKKMNAINCRKN